jgi:phosphatidylglycerophosphatase A
MPNPTPQKKTLWAWTIATFFGSGLLKPGPGTWGSAATLVLWMATAQILRPTHLPLLTLIAAIIAIIVGIPAATTVARESGGKDPSQVVIDEVAGQLIPLIICPPDWPHAILAFLLFRLFDIFKPWPIRRLEQLPAGTGIVLDDIAAGIFALAAFALIHLRF